MVNKTEVLARYNVKKDTYLFKFVINVDGGINLIDFGISNKIGMEAERYSDPNKKRRIDLLKGNKYHYSADSTYEHQDVIERLNSYANAGEEIDISTRVGRLITILAGANCTNYESEKLKVYVDRVGRVIKLNELDEFLK